MVPKSVNMNQNLPMPSLDDVYFHVPNGFPYINTLPFKTNATIGSKERPQNGFSNNRPRY